MSYISPIECDNKENWDLLRILLSVVVQDDDGLLYLNTTCDCDGGSGTSPVELSTSLVEGDNVFLLTKVPSIIQFYSVSLVGVYTAINLQYSFIGANLTVNSGNIYTNISIMYI